jgi:hypothetical protein
MTTRSVASKQYRKQEAFSQPPPVPVSQKRPGQVPSNSSTPATQSSAQNKQLSVSDAIGLITIRLSKVEAYLLKNKDAIDGTAISTTGEHADLDTIVRNLVNRTNDIEKEHASLKTLLNSDESTTTTTASDKSETYMVEISSINERLQTLENAPAPVTDSTLSGRVEKNSQDIIELKQMILKLQTMLLDTIINRPTTVSTPSSSSSVSVEL